MKFEKWPELDFISTPLFNRLYEPPKKGDPKLVVYDMIEIIVCWLPIIMSDNHNMNNLKRTVVRVVMVSIFVLVWLVVTSFSTSFLFHLCLSFRMEICVSRLFVWNFALVVFFAWVFTSVVLNFRVSSVCVEIKDIWKILEFTKFSSRKTVGIGLLEVSKFEVMEFATPKKKYSGGHPPSQKLRNLENLSHTSTQSLYKNTIFCR